MTIAMTQERFLVQRKAEYDLLLHPHTGSSRETAIAAHIPEDYIAKAIVVKDAADYAIVIIPANRSLQMDELGEELQRELHLATEEEIAQLFNDCEPGAVPPLGPAYGVETLLDEALTSLDDVYFEAGDHKQLVHIRGEDFQGLLRGARRGYYSHDS
ncbi:MAG: YbaK/EbsC family protein [Pseudomonadota bacterium]|nr:YbaK/EbsC family protein [Pseudomonadota bacterium]